VEPVEINAGAWYLRGGLSDACYVWEVCEPTTGAVVAEVTLDPTAATVAARAREGHDAAADVAAEAVRRFAAGALGITVRD
jgi:hypothetical protein